MRHGRKPDHGRPRRPARPLPEARATVRLYGVHAVLAAVENPRRRLFRLLVTPERRRDLGVRLEAALAGARGPLALEERTRHELDIFVGPGTAHQGLVLEAAPLPEPGIEALTGAAPETGPAVVLVLDQVTDPQNVGAIVRAAAAFGALGLVLQARHAPPETGALAKAASGGIEHVAMARVPNIARALQALKAAGFWIVGLTAGAETALAEAPVRGEPRLALVLGAEGSGLRRLTRAHCDVLARLPLAGPVESLNVAAAAACALYEVFRAG